MQNFSWKYNKLLKLQEDEIENKSPKAIGSDYHKGTVANMISFSLVSGKYSRWKPGTEEPLNWKMIGQISLATTTNNK